jgi:hypothetical protein
MKGGYRNFGKSYPPGRLANAKVRLRDVEGWTPGVGQLGSPGQEVLISRKGSESIKFCHQSIMFPGHQLHHQGIDGLQLHRGCLSSRSRTCA